MHISQTMEGIVHVLTYSALAQAHHHACIHLYMNALFIKFINFHLISLQLYVLCIKMGSYYLHTLYSRYINSSFVLCSLQGRVHATMP